MIRQDLSEMNVVFIHSKLDDMNLTQAEFRLYCHLARRANQNGKSFPSYKTIAEKCRMSRPSINKTITSLEGIGMLTVKRSKDGVTPNIYTLTKPSSWRENSPEGATGEKSSTQQQKSSKKPDGQPKASKEAKNKANKPSPLDYRKSLRENPKFIEAWELYAQSRREKRTPIKPTSHKLMIAKSEKVTDLQVIAGLMTAAEAGWTGFFPQKESADGKGGKSSGFQSNREKAAEQMNITDEERNQINF